MKKILPFLAAVVLFTISVSAKVTANMPGNDTARKTHLITNRPYVGIGLDYVAGLSKNSPYKAGFNLHDVVGFPVFKQKMVIEEEIGFDFRFEHNRDWNTRAYNGWNGRVLLHIVPFFSGEFTLGAYPVIVNYSHFTAIAGPLVGITTISAMSASGDMFFSTTGFAFTPCYGLKASAFVGTHVMLSAQYFMTPISDVNVDGYNFPVTFNVLRAGITYYRGPSTWLRDKLAAKRARKKAAKATITADGSSQ